MTHQLNSNDQWFLNLHRTDLLTQRNFRSGDQVVVCSKCRAVSLKESWEFNGSNKCIGCGGTRQEAVFSRSFITFSDLANNNGSRWTYKRFRILKAGRRAKRRIRTIALSLQAEKRILVAMGIAFCAFLVFAIVFSLVNRDSGGLKDGYYKVVESFNQLFQNVSVRIAQIHVSRIMNQLRAAVYQVSHHFGSLSFDNTVASLWQKILQLFDHSKEFPEVVLSFTHRIVSWFQNLF